MSLNVPKPLSYGTHYSHIRIAYFLHWSGIDATYFRALFAIDGVMKVSIYFVTLFLSILSYIFSTSFISFSRTSTLISLLRLESSTDELPSLFSFFWRWPLTGCVYCANNGLYYSKYLAFTSSIYYWGDLPTQTLLDIMFSSCIIEFLKSLSVIWT